MLNYGWLPLPSLFIAFSFGRLGYLSTKELVRRATFTASFALITTAVSAQIENKCCHLEDSLVGIIQEEAAFVTYYSIHEQMSSATEDVELPQALTENFYNAICAVRSSSLSVVDSIFNILNFQYHPYFELNQVSVIVDEETPWLIRLRDSGYPTGYTKLDRIIDEYSLTVRSIHEIASTNQYSVYFNSDHFWNVDRLNSLFEQLDGVEAATVSRRIGDGDRLEGSVFDDHVQLLYSIGLGDCPAGCIYRRFWKFNIYRDCRVEFTGRDSELDAAENVEQFAPKIYPTPFRSTLEVELGGRSSHYDIYTIDGRLVQSGTIVDKESIPITSVAAGLYVIRLMSQTASYSQIIIKQ